MKWSKNAKADILYETSDEVSYSFVNTDWPTNNEVTGSSPGTWISAKN
jgi:hypothetical protein